MFRIKNKKLMALTAAAVVAMPISVKAATTNIDAVAVFLAALTLANQVDMDFGTIEYAAAPGAGDTVSLGTDGSIAYAGDFSGPATGTAGSVDITTGSNTYTVEVFCDTTATMSNGAGATINVVGIEADAENSTGAYGTGNPCNGVAGLPATNLVLNLTVLDTFKFGGQIDGATAAGFVAGSYSTASLGGNDIQIDVFYQ